MKLIAIIDERGLTKLQLALNAKIAPSDLYSAINGNKPFYPAWRQRIAEYLKMDESVIFCEGDEIDD